MPTTQHHGQANYTLRDPEEPSKYPETKRLYGFSGRRECFLPCVHRGITSQIFQQPVRNSNVPKRRVYSVTTRRVLVLYQPKIAYNTISINKTAPSSLLLSSYRVVPLPTTARLVGRVWAFARCALMRAGIRTLLYVDDLLACCGTEEEAFIAREINAKTLEDVRITKSPTKGQWPPS